jgi:glycerol-3-phosphate cytidylyltransferase
MKKKIGVVFSSFDLIHPGHIRMLKDAKNQCDYLIVGVQDDPTIDIKYRNKTGIKNKPIYLFNERIEMIESIKYIDEHFTYHTEDDLYKWLKENRWDIRILGSDWKGKKFTGCDINKGEIYFHEREAHGLSSSEIRKRLNII